MGVFVTDALGFIGEVPAGHDQWPLPVGQQKVVQRAVWQHEPQRCLSRRNAVGQRCSLAPGQEHDGRRWGGQQVRLLCVDSGIVPYDVEVPRHEREWLGVAPLAAAQFVHGSAVGGVAGKVESANPLDG